MPAGDHESIANKLFDFMDPGLYTINATVSGWLVGTGNVTSYKEVQDVNFTTVIEYEIEVNIDAPEVYGIYGKELFVIECNVTNMGNGIVWDTNVSLIIKNVTSGAPEDLLESWEILDPLPPEMESDVILFLWMPSKEGVTSNYEINITAKNATLNQMNSATLQVQVINITDIHLVSMVVEPPQIYPTGSFLVNVLLNNTGNARGTGDVRLLIYPEGQPGNVVIDETGTSGLISPEQGGSGRQNENEINFLGLLVDNPGNYTVEARLLGTPEVIFGDLSVIDGAHWVRLKSHTAETSVKEGTEMMFSVTYENCCVHQGNVTLFIDGEPFIMTNESDDWDEDMEFKYTWLAKGVGIHYYYFFTEDEMGANYTLKNATDEPFTFNVTERTHGWVYGKVTCASGNVSGAELVIYSTKLNNTNATVPDTYFNTTTDANGNYFQLLPFSEYHYVIQVKEEWLMGDCFGADPSSETFLVDRTHEITHINFTLWHVDPPIESPKYDITGRVSPPQTMVTIDGTAVEVNVLTNMFTIMNLTNGSYRMRFSANGYITHYMNVTIIDCDLSLGQISLVLENTGGQERLYHVSIGPLKDSDGDGMAGVSVSFILDGVVYMSMTRTDGIATFELPVEKIPEGTLITAGYGDEEITWKMGEGYPDPGPPTPPPTRRNEEKSDTLLIVSVIIIVFIVLTVTILVIKFGRGEEEIPPNGKFRYHPGNAVDPPGSSRGMDFSGRFPCYNCGKIITNDKTKCGRCGTDFDNDEMLFSVNEGDESGRI